MNFYFPEGSVFYFSQTFAAALTVSALSNAADAIATSTAHALVDNDEVLLLSGWEDANSMVARVDQQDTDHFKVLGLDTTDTNFYPPGSGIGTVKKISGWTAIPGVLGIDSSGGDPRFTTVDLLAKRNSIDIPTGFNSTKLNLTMVHDPADANYKTMLSISRRLTPVAFKQVISGGATAYGYGYMAVNEVPKLARNNVNSVQSSLAIIGRMMSY